MTTGWLLKTGKLSLKPLYNQSAINKQSKLLRIDEDSNTEYSVRDCHQTSHLTLNDQYSHHIENSQLICRANQLTSFYIIGTLVVKGLINKQI